MVFHKIQIPFLRDFKLHLPAGLSIKHAVSELLATCIFVYIGVGTASTSSVRPISQEAEDGENSFIDLEQMAKVNLYLGSWTVSTALAFGFAIIVLAYATAGLSGGQMNPAVTLGLTLSGALSWYQCIANTAAQVIGAILGSAFLLATLPDHIDSTLGSNLLNDGVGLGNALCGEILMTLTLVMVVLETVVSGKEAAWRAQAPLAIGFAVFCAHTVLLPIDGCSINPARSLGPAIVSSTWPSNFWVFVVGPYIGSILAVPIHLFFKWEFEVHPQDARRRSIRMFRNPQMDKGIDVVDDTSDDHADGTDQDHGIPVPVQGGKV